MQNRDHFALAYLTKNRFGFWTLWYKDEAPLKSQSYVHISWFKSIGFTGKYAKNRPEDNCEWNLLYYGVNAVKTISIYPDMLPAGVTYYVEQWGGTYIIRFVTYGNASVFNSINIEELIGEAIHG